MNISNSLQNAYRLKSTSPKQIIEQVRTFILANTDEHLHKRINDKIDNLNFDIKLNLASSEFKYQTNTIYISVNHILDIDVYLHEIMHAVGTEIKENCVMVGLNKKTETKLNDKYSLYSNLGYAVNEGLNQHYTETFLPPNIKPSEVATDYSFCANIMSNLENIIGKSLCQTAHFSGLGIDYLINAMIKSCNLPNENKPLKFILQLDAYKQIARTHQMFGITYSTDSKIMLLEAYQSLITLALKKAKFENNDILFSDVIKTTHLTNNNLSYFRKYLQSPLIKFFYQEKEHILNDKESTFVGLQSHQFKTYSEMLFKNFVDNNSIANYNIPEEVKCGEFYNYIFLNCMLYSNNSSELIKTNDFFKQLTIDIFDKINNLTPNHEAETAQLIKHILASRNVVRCGATISDEIIIECTKDVSFNLFLIETMPNYYKELLPSIPDDVKYQEVVLNKIFDEVLTTLMEKYKFIKQMPDNIQNSKKVQDVLNQINLKAQNITK